MVARTLYYTEGDTLPKITGVVKDADGVVIDISAYTITMHIGYSTPKEVEATITDGPSGAFEIEFDDDDLVAGVYNFEIELNDGSGGIATVGRVSNGKKGRIKIYEEIA